MNWFYMEEGRKLGPVSGAEFESLVSQGKISEKTPVWNELLGKWRAYGEVCASKGIPVHDVQGGPDGPSVQCSQCGRSFSPDDVVHYNGHVVCAACKPEFFQRLRESASIPGEFNYGGFWIRGSAVLIDGIILGTVFMLLNILFPFHPVFTGHPGLSSFPWSRWTFQTAIAAAYGIFFIGSLGATPGKMLFGLKAIRSDGGKVSYGRATGRHFAKWLSSSILMFGFMMAGWDIEKRSLHDRLCDTRVIRK